MGKKTDKAESKKECPSCGLGVALDAAVCEFCGWDFEEEDEWILQIEKLERDLMLEKKKFEPGTVEEKIESTLHTPALERIRQAKERQERGIPEPAQKREMTPTPATREAASPRTRTAVTEASAPGIKAEGRERPNAPVRPATAAAGARVIESGPKTAQPKVRRVRSLKAPSEPKQHGANAEGVQAKSRLVRKVKQ